MNDRIQLHSGGDAPNVTQGDRSADTRAQLERELSAATGSRLTRLLARLAVCCDAQEDPAAAVEFARRTLMRAPGDRGALRVLTLNLFRLRSDVRAWHWLSELRRLHPESLGIYWDLLRLFQIQERVADAVTLARELECSYPEDPDILGMAACVYHAVGSSDEAWGSAQRALDRAPQTPLAHEAMSSVLLSQGRFREGFGHVLALDELGEHTNARAEREDPASAPLASEPNEVVSRPWRGEPLEGERLLVVGDPSIARNLQLGRYLFRVASRAERVGFTGPAELRPLFTQLPEVEWLDVPASMSATFHCSLLTLAARHHQEHAEVPVLEAPFALESSEQRLIPPGRASDHDGEDLRVGLCWTTAAAGALDVVGRQRNIPIERLRPLFAREGVRFRSLVVDTRAAESELRAEPEVRDALAVDAAPKNLVDAGRRMEELDLIISVDAPIAHLAGNLELPVWVLLAHRPDPLWAQDGGHCSWYPTARIFRQPQRGDWDRVVRDVGGELDALIPSKR